MDATQQEALARALRGALAGAGILVERGINDRSGNRIGWEEVPAEAVLYRLMADFKWKVSLTTAAPAVKVLPFEVLR